MTIQSQLDQVLTLAEKATQGIWETRDSLGFGYLTIAAVGDPDGLCINVNAPENAKAIIASMNFLREHGPAIRAAVGGEAVAWAHKDGMRILQDDGEGSLYLTSDRQDEYGQTIPLYASPPATVDVGAMRRALTEYPDKNPQQSQAHKVCAGVLKLAASYAGEER